MKKRIKKKISNKKIKRSIVASATIEAIEFESWCTNSYQEIYKVIYNHLVNLTSLKELLNNKFLSFVNFVCDYFLHVRVQEAHYEFLLDYNIEYKDIFDIAKKFVY